MSNNPNLDDNSQYNPYQFEQFPPRKRKKKKEDDGRMWLGLGCLGLSAIVLSILLASLVFWLADDAEATPIVQTTPTTIPTRTSAPTITLTFTPDSTATPQGLFLTTSSPVVTDILPTLAPQLTPVPLDNRAIDLRWIENGTRLVAASSQGIWVFDLQNPNDVPQKLNTRNITIASIAVSRDEQWLAVAYETGFLQLWGLETLLAGEDISTGQTVLDIEFSPTEDILATALENGTIAFWSVPDLAEQTQLTGSLTNFSLAYRADGQQLAAGGINSRVDLWDIAAENKTTINADHVGWVIALDYAPNGQWVASSSEGGVIFVTDSATSERLYTLPAQANVLQFSPDSTRLASGGEDGILRIWDFADGEQFAEFDHPAAITSLAFRFDGAWIAVGGLDERIAIWEISAGNLRYERNLE